MKKAMTKQSMHFNDDRIVVRKEKTHVKFRTKTGKIVRVEALKTSILKMKKKTNTLE